MIERTLSHLNTPPRGGYIIYSGRLGGKNIQFTLLEQIAFRHGNCRAGNSQLEIFRNLSENVELWIDVLRECR